MPHAATPSRPVVPPGSAPSDLAHLLGHSPAAIAARYRAFDRPSAVERLACGPEARLCQALEELGREISDRLALMFRDQAACRVDRVSPLVVDACAVEGLDLDALAGSMRLDDVWRPWLGGPPPRLMPSRPDELVRDARRHRAAHALPRFLRCGVVVREAKAPRGAFGVRAGARCLELGTSTSAAAIRTRDGEVFLRLRFALPDAVVAAAAGRPLDAIVDHPYTFGRGYRVTRARATAAGGTDIRFRAEPLPWTMPWARGADAAAEPPVDRCSGLAG